MGEREATLRIDGVDLAGTIAVPDPARALVIFAHGSGSSRSSPRNRFVARALNQLGIATLRMDLLTGDEERLEARTAELRFDVAPLARRIREGAQLCRAQPRLRSLPSGYFGASTGAAAALIAAAGDSRVGAIVSRGARPDLVGPLLADIFAATLLIVGERDPAVLSLNRQAASQLRAPSEIAVVPGAGHLFEEAGALEEVCRLAKAWFVKHLLREAPPA